MVHIWIRNSKGEYLISQRSADRPAYPLMWECVVNGVKFTDIVDVWLFEYDGPVSLEQATTKEVAQTVWMTREQIRELFDTGKMVHTLNYFFTTEGL